VETVKIQLERCRLAKDELAVLENAPKKSEKIKKEIHELKVLRSRCENLIMNLPHTVWRKYLLTRFIFCETYSKMAELFDVDERTCYRNVKKGIQALENMQKNKNRQEKS